MTGFEQQSERVRGLGVRAGTGPARAILEPLRAVLAVALNPLVTGFPADPEAIAQLRCRERAASFSHGRPRLDAGAVSLWEHAGLGAEPEDYTGGRKLLGSF